MSSRPPETGEIDASWDDEPNELTLPGENTFDRATVVPDEPPGERARRLDAESRATGCELPLEPAPDFDPGSFPPLPPEPTTQAGGPVTPLPSYEARNARTNPEPLRPRMDLSSSPDSLPPPDEDRATPWIPSAQIPSVPQGRRTPTGLEVLTLEEETGSALDLVSRPRQQVAGRADPFEAAPPTAAPPPPSAGSPIVDMKDRYAVGDYTGALVIAESVLETDPTHVDAKRHAESCREILTQMYAARLGSLDQVLRVAVPPDQIRWLSLDHRAGFLLSLVDGVTSVEEILDVSGMSRLDALRILFTLVQQRVVGLEGT
ncbi:MAG: hypothetical protein KIT72_13975 [Polyangiaceae bacterium]|nr:hypothetical protein [Polyangiaceae bacterium]MCW5791520.1 hypothetical protein [Polyangiaceae bacterium]